MSADLKRIEEAKRAGQEVIAVLGLGFVGTAVVANLARSEMNGKPRFLVVGIDQNTPQGKEKCARLNEGLPPVYASDASLTAVITKAALETKNVMGTVETQALKLADVVIFCINLDLQRTPGQTEKLQMNVDGYADAMRMVGRHIVPGTLVTVESTLPIGTCDTKLYPGLCAGQKDQGIDIEKNPPLLAYCYERVMPGPDYLDSVNNFWRSYAGVNKESSRRAREFLNKFVNTAEYPLWEHKSTRAAEMSKLLENAYRATNIAFINEWSNLAEQAGVDLFDVISSIRLRKGTHDNMMLPGLGVGGYCLTKDALLAAYGAENLLKVDATLPFSREAILTNERMPLKAVDWVRDHFDGKLKGRNALLVGVTYRPGVADTRSSSTEIVGRALVEAGAKVSAHDPLIDTWEEFPTVPMLQDPLSAEASEIVVICLPDKRYSSFLKELLTKKVKSGGIVIDPWNMVGEALAQELAQKQITLRVYGRGDIGGAASHT